MRTLTAVLLPAIPDDADGGPRPEGWHYASVSRRGGHPIGYCREHPPHPTEADARDCYTAYQRDNVTLDQTLGDWTGCEARTRDHGTTPDRDGILCDAPTKTAAHIRGEGFQLAGLCAEHLTRDHAIVALHLDRPAGDAWVS